MRLVFLYGPPAAGKLTIGRELAALTGFRLFHNHLTVDLARELFDFGSEPFQRLVDDLRLRVFTVAAQNGLPGLIFTYVYGADRDDDFARRTLNEMQAVGAEVSFVQVICPPEELLNRVENESRRAYHKLASRETLDALLQERDWLSAIPFVESFPVDTTRLTPADAAREIAVHFQLPKAE
jgi:chloramphenicol 3-O-phosphotransferase